MITSGFSFAGTATQLVRNFDRSQERVFTSIEQLSTGKRINRPSDDPTGFVAAEEIRGELIQLRGETKAATYRRVNFLQQHAESLHIQKSAVETRSRLEDTREESINIGIEDVSENIPSSAYASASGNRIDEVFVSLRQDKEVILTETLSMIEDTDFAVVTAELVQGQILSNAAVAALAYANQEMTDQVGQLFGTLDVTAG